MPVKLIEPTTSRAADGFDLPMPTFEVLRYRAFEERPKPSCALIVFEVGRDFLVMGRVLSGEYRGCVRPAQPPKGA